MKFIADYNYQFYGSKDSLDTDVILFLDKIEMNICIEDRKRLVNKIKEHNSVDYNIMLATLQDGIIVDCMVPSSVDSLNNAAYTTYKNFNQPNANQINKLVRRNLPLAYYRTVHTIMSYLCRTKYRSIIRPVIHYSFNLETKFDVINEVDFTTITDFNQKNVDNSDVWKKLAFYIVQQNALSKNIELYDKAGAKFYEKKSINFIDRNELTIEDKIWLNSYISNYITYLSSLNFIEENNILKLNAQSCDIKTFKPIIT